jgi:hypothetical protein
LIDDPVQHLGTGTELYRQWSHIARKEKLKRLQETVLIENREMRAVCQKLSLLWSGMRRMADLDL